MPRVMSSAEAIAIQEDFDRLAPSSAEADEIKGALDVVSVGIQAGHEGIFVRLVGRDDRVSDVFLNPAAAMIVNGTLRQALEDEGWVDNEGFVTSG